AMFRNPPERNASQVAEKERRIADGCEAAADVRDDENEKDDVMRGGTMLVQAQPGTDQQHGCAGGAEEICECSADEQKEDVKEWRAFASNVNVDSAGDDVE